MIADTPYDDPPVADRYTRLLDAIITEHHLSDFARGRFADPDSVFVVIAAKSGISRHNYADLTTQGQTPATSQPARSARDADALYSITPIPCNPDIRYAYVTRQGRMIIADALGNVRKSVRIGSTSAWHITCARLRNRWFLFACCGETLHVFDTTGAPIFTIDMPGRMLSITAGELNGRVWLAGGANAAGGEVYMWDVDTMIRARDATPYRTLRGGQKPAFATHLYESAGAPWVAHGSWDGCIYLYALNEMAGPRPCPATLALRAPAPVYPITTVTLNGVPWLLAGCEDGSIGAWDMTALRDGKRPDYLIAGLRTRVKCMTYAEVGHRPILFAGCENGCLYAYDLSTLPQPVLMATVATGNGEVRGVALIGVSS